MNTEEVKKDIWIPRLSFSIKYKEEKWN